MKIELQVFLIQTKIDRLCMHILLSFYLGCFGPSSYKENRLYWIKMVRAAIVVLYMALQNCIGKIIFETSNKFRFCNVFYSYVFFTPPRNHGGIIFSLQFVCVCVSVCVAVRLNSCEKNSSRTDEQIWTRFSLNGCLEHWLKPYGNWWPWVKVTVTENVSKNDKKIR